LERKRVNEDKTWKNRFRKRDWSRKRVIRRDERSQGAGEGKGRAAKRDRVRR
jgi:hypothetical protein